MKREIINIMCDYCADGIWWNGYATKAGSKKLPYSLRLLKRRLDNWQLKYERMYKHEYSRYELKYEILSKAHRKFVEEGREIAKRVRKQSPVLKFKVTYFNEATLDRENIKKGRLN